MGNPKRFRISAICFISAALLWFYAGLLGKRAVFFVLGCVFMVLGVLLLSLSFKSKTDQPK
ncbi:MAG: hypothetical protein QUS35_04645 [bacterium]|nr:hypothetical protein [bacterium]